MKFFLHDSNAFYDEKVTELYMRFGYEGVGLFYVALERLAQQEQPMKTDILKQQLRVGKRLEKCWKFMEEIGILSSSNGETFNEKLLKYSEKYLIKKEKTKERVANFRAKKEDVTHYNHGGNARKYNIIKDNIIYISLSEAFDQFWNAYPRKVGKEKAREVFARKKPPIEKVLLAIEEQAKTPQWQDPKYIPHPTTWLNRGSWDDEVEKVSPLAQEEKDVREMVASFGQNDALIHFTSKYGDNAALRHKQILGL